MTVVIYTFKYANLKKKNLNVDDHKNQNLREKTVWSPWQTMVSMVNIGSSVLKKGAQNKKNYLSKNK